LLPVSASILVVDGGSTDGTVNICRKQIVKLIMQSGKGKGKHISALPKPLIYYYVTITRNAKEFGLF
jgi:glycosyltransferase involved in cell wall biosynthesis